jgi:hypothetical protein
MPSPQTDLPMRARNRCDLSPEVSSGGSRSGRRVARGVGFQPIKRPSTVIYVGLGLASTGTIKPFMDLVVFMYSNRHRFWSETIKSPDFYGF